jgi:hypothetical protein
MAGVIASISNKSDDYQFNIKMKPLGGALIDDISTNLLGVEDSSYVTGVLPSLGGIQPTWSHHVNVYQNIAGYRVLVEGISATGHYIDDIIHRRYIEDELNNQLLDLLVNDRNVSMSDLSKVRTRLTVIVRSFVRNGVISDVQGAIDTSDFVNIFASGNGWVLSKQDTKQSNLDSRITPNFTFCYVRQGGVNFISIGLCESAIGVV